MQSLSFLFQSFSRDGLASGETMMSPDNSPNLMLICDLDETQIIISPVWFYFIASDESQQCVLVQLNSWELGDVVFFTFYVLMGIYFSQDPLLLFFLYLLWSYCSASCAVWRVLVISLAVFILLDWKIIAEFSFEKVCSMFLASLWTAGFHYVISTPCNCWRATTFGSDFIIVFIYSSFSQRIVCG
jgi:hypothetical protein